MYEQRTLRRIKKEFDYQTYCEAHYRVKPTGREDEIRICCPHCGDGKFKCYVNDEKKKFNCYKCDFNTGNFDVFDLVAFTEDIPRGKAVLRLVQDFAPTTPLTIEEIIAQTSNIHYEVTENEVGKTSEIRKIDTLPREAFPLTDPGVQKENKFWNYLLVDRGLTTEEVLACKVHYVYSNNVPIHKINGLGETKYVGDIGRRVLFPVYGPGGGLVSWLSRPVREDFNGPKYLNCPDSEINRTLWPVVEPYKDVAVVTEGIIDALSVRRLGPPFSSYCSFGKSLGYEQIELLKSWGISTVILFWDPEERRAMSRAVEVLKMQFDEVFVPRFDEWPAGKDPGDMLTYEDGDIHLEKALCDPISVQSLEYLCWQVG